jgi:hypothetical protein
MKYLLLLSLMLASCTSTTVKKDDHSYTYVYQHNAKSAEESQPVQNFTKKNREYTSYKQVNRESEDSEFLDSVEESDNIRPYNRPNRVYRPQGDNYRYSEPPPVRTSYRPPVNGEYIPLRSHAPTYPHEGANSPYVYNVINNNYNPPDIVYRGGMPAYASFQR